MVKRGHDAVGIELEVVGLELVALEQIEFYLFERQLLGIENETNTLAAGRLRSVVQRESHLDLPFERFGGEWRRCDMCLLHIHHEIYGQFTCDSRAGSFEWIRAQPPFSSLQA